MVIPLRLRSAKPSARDGRALARVDDRRGAAALALASASLLLLLIALILLAAPSRADATDEPAQRDPARGEAIVEGDVPQLVARLLVSESEPARVGVLFEMAPGWHL